MRFFVFALLLPFVNPVWADEIRVLSGGAARHALEPMTASFPAHKVTFDFQTMGKLQQSLAAGQKLWGSRFGKVTSYRLPARKGLTPEAE